MKESILFDEAVLLASGPGVSSSQKYEIRPSWYAWVARNCLHVIKNSRQRGYHDPAQHRVSHFGVDEFAGYRLIFINKPGESYCFCRPGARNAVEEACVWLNQSVRAELVDTLDEEILESNLGSSFHWWSALTDGVLSEADQRGPLRPGRQRPQARQGERLLKLTGGTYAVLWRDASPDCVLQTPGADQQVLPGLILAENALRWLALSEEWNSSDGLHLQAFAELVVLLSRNVLLPKQAETFRAQATRFERHLPDWMKLTVWMGGPLPEAEALGDLSPFAYPSAEVVRQILVHCQTL